MKRSHPCPRRHNFLSDGLAVRPTSARLLCACIVPHDRSLSKRLIVHQLEVHLQPYIRGHKATLVVTTSVVIVNLND